MQLRRRLRSEKELRARAEERLAVANSSVDELTAALAHAKRKAQAASGGARQSRTLALRQRGPIPRRAPPRAAHRHVDAAARGAATKSAPFSSLLL